MIVGKAVQMAQMMHVPILGLVENMSYAVCPDCGKHINVFGDSHVDEIADKYKLPVLAKMPIDPELAKEADAGMIEMFAGDYLDNAAQTVAKLWDEYQLSVSQAEQLCVEFDSLTALRAQVADLRGKIRGIGKPACGTTDPAPPVSGGQSGRGFS